MSLKFYTDQLLTLGGATITGVAVDGEGGFFGLTLRLPDGESKVLWLQSDDEGNGPGSFSLEDA